MTRLPRTLLALVAGLGLTGQAAAASAAPTTYPSITKVAPLTLGVGDAMTVTGKSFRRGTGRNTVVFKRKGGRAVFVRAGKSTPTKLSVKIPAKLLGSLSQKSGKPVPTRFQIRVLSARLGRSYTALKRSPLIGPVATTAKANPQDCDNDLTPNTKDTDDDNDLLSDTLEATLKTDACKRDSDGDGMSDGWEHESALDYNGRAKPTPLKRPYPNALDPKDGNIDSDGDGLTNALEYAAWATYGGNRLPLSYSGGELASGGKAAPPGDRLWSDRDGNGFLSDIERDADGDGIPNQDEGGITPLPVQIDVAGFFADEYIEGIHDLINVVPLYGPLPYVHKVFGTDWLDADSDGDTIRDGADDQDHDGVANLDEMITELAATTKTQRPLNACEPSLDARLCSVGDGDIDNDGRPNRDDDDVDEDGLLNRDELNLTHPLNPYKADTDGDGVGDGFEYYSALDLNGKALPYPGKQPYPNPLDKDDATIDHDGDGLTLGQEFKAWTFQKLAGLPLSYSDGNQTSDGGSTIDGYRDVDGDGASNYAEVGGPLSGPDFWTRWVQDNNRGCPGADGEYLESTYPGPRYQGLNFVDFDSDGDGIGDGADDIDHDGLSNLEESRWVDPNTGEAGGIRRPDWCAVYVSLGPGGSHNAPDANTPGVDQPGADRYARIDPFNPCKPVRSAACHRFIPLGYYPYDPAGYSEDWRGAEPNR